MSEQVTIERHELDTLLAVAGLYINAFAEDEAMSLTEKLALQDVEAVVARYGAGSGAPGRRAERMSDDKRREELCPACLAFPGEHDERVIVARADGTTVETWHKEGCLNLRR